MAAPQRLRCYRYYHTPPVAVARCIFVGCAVGGGWGANIKLLAQVEEGGGCQRFGKEVGKHVARGYVLDFDCPFLGLVGKVMVAHVYECSALRGPLFLATCMAFWLSMRNDVGSGGSI